MITEKTKVSADKQPLTLKQCAELIGLSKSYLYRLTSEKKIPHYKPRGKKLYFEKSEVTAWVLQNRVSTTAEVETAAANYCVNNQR